MVATPSRSQSPAAIYMRANRAAKKEEVAKAAKSSRKNARQKRWREKQKLAAIVSLIPVRSLAHRRKLLLGLLPRVPSKKHRFKLQVCASR